MENGVGERMCAMLAHIIIIVVHQTNDYYFIHLMLSRSQSASEPKEIKKRLFYDYYYFVAKSTYTRTVTERKEGGGRRRKPANPHKSSKIDGYSMLASPMCECGKEIEFMPATGIIELPRHWKRTRFISKWFALTGSTIPCLMAQTNTPIITASQNPIQNYSCSLRCKADGCVWAILYVCNGKQTDEQTQDKWTSTKRNS